jgi:cytosine/adenosine deaminase-related metal-dependent hydrolase
MKNLLCGVTTVAHHDPFYPGLAAADFPVQVLARYGWSHSLYMDGEEAVREACHATPAGCPWIIHAAEGVDPEAGAEFERLDALGCLRTGTLLVHGVALEAGQLQRLATAGAGLIWCPSSNLRLFGSTVDVAGLCSAGCVALGTDSRLTGARDLLAELAVARETAGLDEETLERLVTGNAARLLQLADRGSLATGARADLLVMPAGLALSRAVRGDVRLVVIGGTPAYGDPAYMGTEAAAVRVDGRPKGLAGPLAQRLAAAVLREEGLELPRPES